MIPRGTGWDFARTYKIPHKLDGAIDVALTGTTRTIDLGRASYRAWDGSDGGSYFANVASAGMSGAIAQRANETTKALGGKVSYLWATLAVFAKWQNSELRLTVDGETRVGQMHDVVVANGKTFGGGMIICPDAEPDDGLFDVLTIGDLTKRDLLMTLPKTFWGKHLPHPKAELLRGSVVTVDADAPLPVELDGEQPGTTPVRFEIVPRALRLRVPAGLGGRVLRRRRGLRAAGFFAAGFFTVAASCFSSAVTLFSSSSRPRSFFCISSSRAFDSFIMSTTFEPPGTSVSLFSASWPSSVKRARMSFCLAVLVFAVVLVFAMARSYPSGSDSNGVPARTVISARTTSEGGEGSRHQPTRGVSPALQARTPVTTSTQLVHRFESCSSRSAPNVKGEMAASNISKRAGQLHEHKAVIAHALRQHAGIPYEVEQKVCTDCRTVLDERTVRAAA